MNDKNLFGKRYLNYLKNRGFIRKFVRYFYLKNVLKFVDGPIVDFGCGVGDLLRIAPNGSVGLEINKEAVKYCQENGLNVKYCDNYELEVLKNNKYVGLVMCHVLEHLPNPELALDKLFSSALRIGIKKIVIVVPGKKGFDSDKTHNTFVDRSFFIVGGGYRVLHSEYYPVNCGWVGDFFKNNELVVVYEKK